MVKTEHNFTSEHGIPYVIFINGKVRYEINGTSRLGSTILPENIDRSDGFLSFYKLLQPFAFILC